MSSLQRAAAILRAHRLFEINEGRKCKCGWVSPEPDCTWTDHPEHVASHLGGVLGGRREVVEDWHGKCKTTP